MLSAFEHRPNNGSDERCWAGPSQFIRVWIQRRICLVLLEARSDLCPAVISSASNRKIILQTFSRGVPTPHLGARMHGASGGHWHLETGLARPDTVATLHTSTAIIIVGVPLRAVERGISHIRLLCPPTNGDTQGRYRRPPSWESKTQFWGTILGTDATTANRHLPITPTVACLCPRPRTWDSHSHQNSNTRAPNEKLEGPVPEWSGWATRVPSARQR